MYGQLSRFQNRSIHVHCFFLTRIWPILNTNPNNAWWYSEGNSSYVDVFNDVLRRNHTSRLPLFWLRYSCSICWLLLMNLWNLNKSKNTSWWSPTINLLWGLFRGLFQRFGGTGCKIDRFDRPVTWQKLWNLQLACLFCLISILLPTCLSLSCEKCCGIPIKIGTHPCKVNYY